MFRNTSAPPAQVALWAEQLDVSPRLAGLLWQRGMVTADDMQLFLSPGLRHLASLAEWPGLEEAAALLARELLAGKQLCVWGDYDVDGITATALVKDFLEGHGFSCRHYIPERLGEGYGLNRAGISRLADEGVDILLTVDSGITDTAAVAHARNLGMTVIVSDHHLPGESLPDAHAIVNPRLAPCPCPSLAGVGVAFLLMAALNLQLHAAGRPRQDIRPLLDLVALGTLADVVSLEGQNRILVKNGLLMIGNGSRPGIAALKHACNHSPTAFLGAGQVVFALAPRINAAGRLGSSQAALDLLLTRDRDQAAAIAARLSALNAERREEENRILVQALQQAEELVNQGHMGLVLYEAGWHPGVIGIVASRIVETFHRPAVVLCAMEGHLKGSGRSIGAFNLHDAFCSCADLLLGYGGHRMAAGLSLESGRLEAFRQRFSQVAAQTFGPELPEPECLLDGNLPFVEAADFTFLKELELLQPFGSGNAEPVFASPPVRVRQMRARPGLMILDLEDESSKTVLRAKAWRQMAAMPMELKGQRIRIAYTPRIDRYNGAATVELRLKDWKREDQKLS